MYKEKKILGFIPARGGSKGLPRKNIKPLLGKPLIAWTIEQALNSKYIDKVIVSTDDEKIAEIAKQFGAEVPFLRPAKLAQDSSPTIDTILHAINFLEKNREFFEILVLLEPTSPLRKKDDIDNGIKTLLNSNLEATSVISLGKVTLEHPSIIKLVDNGYVIPYDKKDKIYQRQQLKDVYFPYGVFYISYTKNLIEDRTFYQTKTIPYFIERWQNYEIDDIYDFLCIEAVLKHKLLEAD
jgi:CMP-N,N'-diacetyllegionaminic acid synthase